MIAMATALIEEWAAEFGQREDRVGRAYRRARKNIATTGGYEAPTLRGAGLSSGSYNQAAGYGQQTQESRQIAPNLHGEPSRMYSNNSPLEHGVGTQGYRGYDGAQYGRLESGQGGLMRDNEAGFYSGGPSSHRQVQYGEGFRAQPSGLYGAETEMQRFGQVRADPRLTGGDPRDEEIYCYRNEISRQKQNPAQGPREGRSVPQLTYYSSSSQHSNTGSGITASIRRDMKSKKEPVVEDMSKLKLRDRLERFQPAEKEVAKSNRTLVLRGRRAPPPRKLMQLPAPKNAVEEEEYSEEEKTYTAEILSEGEEEEQDYTEGEYEEKYDDEYEEEGEDGELEHSEESDEEEEEAYDVEVHNVDSLQETYPSHDRELDSDEEEGEQHDDQHAQHNALAPYMPSLLDFGDEDEDNVVESAVPQQALFQNIAGHEKQMTNPEGAPDMAQNIQNYLAGAVSPYGQQQMYNDPSMNQAGLSQQPYGQAGYQQGPYQHQGYAQQGFGGQAAYSPQQYQQEGYPPHGQNYQQYGYGQPPQQSYGQADPGQSGNVYQQGQYGAQVPFPGAPYQQQPMPYGVPPGTAAYGGMPYGQPNNQSRAAPAQPEDPRLSSKKKSGMTSVAFTDLSLMALGGGT